MLASEVTEFFFSIHSQIKAIHFRTENIDQSAGFGICWLTFAYLVGWHLRRMVTGAQSGNTHVKVCNVDC